MTTEGLPARTVHKAFSPARVQAIATTTLLELVRLKVFYFLLIFGVVIIGVVGFTSAFDFQFQEQLQFLKDVSLGSMSIFTLALSILTTGMILPNDVEDRTLYTILAKPVPRLEYLLGKLLGVYLQLLIAVGVMAAMFAAALYAKEHAVLQVAMLNPAGLKPEDLKAAIEEIKGQAFTPSLLMGIAMIWVQAALMATLTMMISTIATSYIFTVMISFTCYLIGFLESVARDYLQAADAGQFAKAFLAMVTLVFPDMQLFSMSDDVVAGNRISPDLFLKTAGLGFVYMLVYAAVGYVMFWFKEL